LENNRTVICTWDTYYPLELVSEILEPMKRGVVDHVVEYIKEKHSLVVGRARDIYSARMTTLDEQNLFQLPADEPVLILQRASYTRDKKTLILFSDMVLLGNWFVHEHEYDVPIWDREQEPAR
jgi:DNA-binding GntR family transcriptional regulator